MTYDSTRRSFLRRAGAFGMGLAMNGLAAPHIAKAASTELRIVSNPGLENATLNALMNELGYFRSFGVNARIIQVPGPTGPFDAIARGEADVCMVSGYNLVLARIEQGAPVKIIGMIRTHSGSGRRSMPTTTAWSKRPCGTSMVTVEPTAGPSPSP